ncbi:molybdate ion transmembrane transporter [Aureococcus anophagefferens]|nr:molybdate ion transmembrane transporter [Aureococcus anophagefferens]
MRRAALMLLALCAAARALQLPRRHARAKRARTTALRGGAKPLASLGAAIGASPASLFNAVFGGLAGTAVVAKVASAPPGGDDAAESSAAPPPFGVLRSSGPSPARGQAGRKLGTLAFAVLYGAAALTTKSSLLWVLFAGRVLSGVGTSLLFSAPGVARRRDEERLRRVAGRRLRGGLRGRRDRGHRRGPAGVLAAAAGPDGALRAGVGFLGLGALAASLLWTENVAASADGSQGAPTIREAFDVACADRKILLVGAAQALEGAMYIFVLQWPPAMSRAVGAAFGEGAKVPFGTIFSSFMVCCLLGSTAFQRLSAAAVRTESSTLGMLALATAAMGTAAATAGRGVAGATLASFVAAFFAFELCVGMYFPSIGTLRSKYIPDSHRSVIMNLFGIPLNAIVVGCFLSIKKLGVSGALSVATAALGLATLAAAELARMTKPKAEAVAA